MYDAQRGYEACRGIQSPLALIPQIERRYEEKGGGFVKKLR